MTREERKAAMPKCSKWIDQMRDLFGEPIGIHCSENGHSVTWGEKLGEGVVVATPDVHLAGGRKRSQS